MKEKLIELYCTICQCNDSRFIEGKQRPGQQHLKIRKGNDNLRDMELERLKTALEKLEDPWRTVGGHILHKLEDIIIIGLCTLVCNGEDFMDMEAFGELWSVHINKIVL